MLTYKYFSYWIKKFIEAALGDCRQQSLGWTGLAPVNDGFIH
ncbi:hypothetical protein [Hafnia alvei]|nr:hypothetical protein [Hafnia alvei]